MRIANPTSTLLSTVSPATTGGVRGSSLTAVSAAVTGGVRQLSDVFVNVNQGGCFPATPRLPDVSALVSVWGLENSQGPVTGDQMAAAIEAGVGDKDGQAASSEFRAFADWAQSHQGKLSPEAKEVMRIYEKYARLSQKEGRTGIPDDRFKMMIQEMRNVKDASATAALADLDRAPGMINGDQLAEAIRKGTQDADGKGATDEFKQFADWAKKNEHRLSPEAKQVMGIYEKHAKAAQAKGQSGVPDSDFKQMVREMNNVRDASATRELWRLSMTPGRVSGRQMLDAIRRGTGDFDGKSATDEFKQFADWAKAHPGKLSPAAKQVLSVYEKYAKAAQAHGQSGIALQDYRRMLREMSHAARPQMIFMAARSIAG